MNPPGKKITERRHPRRHYRSRLGFLSKGAYCIYELHEISEGGLLFATQDTQTVETSALFTFCLPGQRFVALEGRIIYQKKNEGTGDFFYGVEFKQMEFEERRLIREFISSRGAARDFVPQ